MGLSPAQRLEADARWHRAEVARLAAAIAEMTPEHKAAIGPRAVRRMHVDHDVNIQLAEELEAYLAREYGAPPADAAALF